jgi:peptidoglycan hydrolase CwlO-like protein
VNNINNEDKKKGVIKEEKFKKVEAEVSTLRKKVGEIMLEKIETEKENAVLKKFIKELENRN